MHLFDDETGLGAALMASIRVESIVKRFGQVTALNGVSFDVADGEFFAILGPPGAGKTTTLRTIVGLEKPDEGDVYLDDDRVTDVWPGDRDIAIVFQNLALYPDKSVYDNLAFPLKRHKVPKQEIKERVESVARTLHIEQLLDRKPAKLSGGERQRVALGRAIVRDPKAFLFDEPISALDALLRLEMRTELKRLQRGPRPHARLRHARSGRGDEHGRPDPRPARRRGPADRSAGGHLPPAGEPLRRDRRRIAPDELPPGDRGALERHPAPAPRLVRRGDARRRSRSTTAPRAGSAFAPRTSTSRARAMRASQRRSTSRSRSAARPSSTSSSTTVS